MFWCVWLREQTADGGATSQLTELTKLRAKKHSRTESL